MVQGPFLVWVCSSYSLAEANEEVLSSIKLAHKYGASSNSNHNLEIGLIFPNSAASYLEIGLVFPNVLSKFICNFFKI